MSRVAVTILTNGNRRGSLEKCVSLLLDRCRYRPLDIYILDNGSTDDTRDYLDSLPSDMYGIRWRLCLEDKDLGCAAGTNRLATMAREYEYVLHLESDFFHMKEEESGFGSMWLSEALDFMDQDRCDYLYLRRMKDEVEMSMHWWSKWARVINTRGKWMHCPGFWWSNNPHLRRNDEVFKSGVLPLNESKDGPKGTPGWSKPELEAGTPGRPGLTWIARWGMFLHETDSLGSTACPKMKGCCKYGFAVRDERFCSMCEEQKGFEDMREHERRYKCLVTG